MHAEPTPQHKWLARLIGEWTYEHESSCDPSKSGEKITGTEIVRPLGELWVMAEGRGGVPGTADIHESLMTLGYDPKKGRYVSTWIGSMATYLWLCEGQLDAEQKVLTLETKGPDFSNPDKLVGYRDVIEIVDDNYRRMKSSIQGDDGAWKQFMTVHYRRTK